MNKIIISIIGIFVMASLVYALATFTVTGGDLGVSSLQKGLVGHWILDGEGYDSNTERITDKTPYENHGTNSGATLTTDQMGQSDRAMSFDGKTARDRISFGSFTIGTTGTYNLWIKGDKTAGVQISENIYPLGIQMKHSLLGPSMGTTERYGLITNDGTNRYYNWGNQDVYDNEWHMYTIAWDGTYVYAWLDGVSVGAPKAHSGQIFLGTGNFYAGAGWSSGYGTHTGELSEVRLYDRVLSVDEIDTLYHSYRPKAASGSLLKGLVLDMPLKFKYTKDETVGSEILTDRTPYSNDGQNYGATVGSNGTSFDGDDYVSVPDDDSLDITETITIEAWIYFRSENVGYAAHPIQKYLNTTAANFRLYYFGTTSGANRMVRFYATAGGIWKAISGGYTVSLGQWYHIALSYTSANGGQLYVNGQPIGGLVGNGALIMNNRPVIIGSEIDGLISNVRIYNRALSSSEIKLLYDKGR